MILLAINLVAVGSPCVANAYAGANSHFAQDDLRGYAGVTGGTAAPAQDLLFGNIAPAGTYGAVATPVVDTQSPASAHISAPPTPMAMPRGRMAPPPKTAIIGGQTAGADAQCTSPSALPKQIVPVGAQ